MVTGFNTDVQHRGKTYHVQTEDKGLQNPIIETLIYMGGEILAARRTSYADLLEKEVDEKTDEAGRVTLSCPLPLLEEGTAALIVQASSGKESAEIKQLIKKPARKAAG